MLSIWWLFSNKTHEQTHVVMGTVAQIQIVERNSADAEIALSKAWAEINRLQAIFNFHDPQSELSQLNQRAFIKPVKVSDDLWVVLEKSFWASELTDGLFDMTVGSLSNLYNFSNSSVRRLPTESELTAAKALIDYRLVELDSKSQSVYFQKKGVLIDLGASAKGYAVDQVVRILRKEGIRSGLVNIGGNIHGFGYQKWKIGIQHPRNSEEHLALINLKNQGVATSGDYERFFIKNHVRLHHIFNPKTGLSATANIGVTVVAKDAFNADIFSTSLFLVDHQQAQKIITKQRLKALLISENKNGELKILRAGL